MIAFCHQCPVVYPVMNFDLVFKPFLEYIFVNNLTIEQYYNTISTTLEGINIVELSLY